MSADDRSVDINTIIAEVISSQIETVFEKLKDTGIAGLETIRVRLKSAYTEYLKRVHKEFSLSRSFFLRDAPTDLYAFYVPVGIASGKNMVPKITSKLLENLGKRIVICGSAGSGKSILLKHLLLDCVRTGYKVPLICELKDLNDPDSAVAGLINKNFEAHGFKIHEGALETGLQKGHFLFLFDGYDELDPGRRISIGAQIRHFSKKYENCTVVLTSRPDPEFSGWEGFCKADIVPLTLPQSCELVEMLPFDAKLKNQFLADLKEHLYKKHQTFLSNPLLLTIMLLTYDENADIPRKLSVFYNQAFEALFHKHDARKGAYKRKRKTTLDIQDFGRVLSAFCLLTYEKRLLKFSEADALENLTRAREIVEISFSPQDFLTDLMQSTCLLIEDGLFLTFAHRSFQEFFVAKFIHEAPPERKEALIERYRDLMGRDSTIALLYELDPHSVEKVIVIPVMEQLIELTRLNPKKLTRKQYWSYLNVLFAEVGVVDGQLIWIVKKTGDRNQFFDVASLILRRLNHLRGTGRPHRTDQAVVSALEEHLGEKSGIVKLTEFASNSSLAKALLESSIFAGGKALVELLEIFSAIQIKHKNRTESLDLLLSTPRNSKAR